MTFIVRRARREDADAIGRVHVTAIRELCRNHYSPAEIEAWAAPRKPEHYLEAIAHKEFYVADDDGVVGFGTMNLAGGEVEAVYVHPAAIRRGVGREVLRTLESRAQEVGLKSLHLCASLNAVQFYERGGFERQQDTLHRLTSGIEIACVLMSKELREETDG